jgi:hypothetical protein
VVTRFQWVLSIVQRFRVVGEPDYILAMVLQKAAAQRRLARRVIVMHAMTCRAGFPFVERWPGAVPV